MMSVSLAIVGCGGGDSSDSSLSRAEFVKRTNAACRKEGADLQERVADFEHLKAGKEPEPYADTVHFVMLPTIERQLFAVGKLPPPVGEFKRVSDLIDVERREIDDIAVHPRVRSMTRARRHFTKS